MKNPHLKVLPLGGLGEIGMNCLVLEYENVIVLIDCGIQFPDASYAGVELLVPDLSYLRANINKIKAIVVTHGHDDHIGAIPFLLKETDLDVYATPFPTGLLKNKLLEHKRIHEIRFHEIKPREKFKVGPFEFDPISVQHSIVEALGFAIETPVGTIVHSGDFKHDPKEMSQGEIGFEAFKEAGEKGVRLLLSDSTNAERPGHTMSEVEIADSFDQMLLKQENRTLIALFASNIKRIEKILHIAKKQGKKVALAGRSMHSYTKLAHEQGQLDIPADTLVLLENIQGIPGEKLIILSTGSQAEPRSALVRIAQGIHKDVQIQAGDQIVLSSRFIPGNEKNITTMIDHLYRAGAEVLYESAHQIHVSGHGFQDELLMMLDAVKPEAFVPVHGEYRHLAKHANLAKRSGVKPENIFIIENGQALNISKTDIVLGEKIPFVKQAIVDNSFIQSSAESIMLRNNLAKTGIVFATLFRNAKSQRLYCRPLVKTYGLLYREGELDNRSTDEAEAILERINDDKSDDPELSEIIRIELRRYYRKHASHKPVVIPIILDI